ncbi:MAG TPA: hypothetical protein VM513_09795 [Kofleriaceae bacterium]|jgi:hypothetical protein|nr:hypothetical protein [Kofleriaceae bacterium]
MRSLLVSPLVALLACSDSGGTSSTPDAADSPDDAVVSDDATMIEPDADLPDPGADFAANGPGAGYQWFLAPAPQDAPYTNCNVGGTNSWKFYADTWQVQSPNPSIKQFGLALQATPGGTHACTYSTDDGTFTCTDTVISQNLNSLPPPYTLDAVVSMKTSASGRFRERMAPDPESTENHTYSARWAADLGLVMTATCSGTQCAQAATGMGVASFPCTSMFSSLESLNYSDPTLSDPL